MQFTEAVDSKNCKVKIYSIFLQVVWLHKLVCVSTVPNAVQNLSVSAVSTNSVNLTWLPPNGNLSLFSYSISFTSSDQTFNTTSNNYQITPLQPGTPYNCSVRVLIIAGNIFGPSQFMQCITSECKYYTSL